MNITRETLSPPPNYWCLINVVEYPKCRIEMFYDSITN